MATPPGRAPTRRHESAQARLARLGFTDTVASAAELDALGLLDDGPAAADLVAALGHAADPDLAARTLGGLRRALDADPAPAGDGATLLAALADDEPLRSRLFAVLGASTRLGEHLVLRPQLWRQLAADCTAPPLTTEQLRAPLLEAVGAVEVVAGPGQPTVLRARDDAPETLEALRLAYRDIQVRVAARDLAGGMDLAEVAAQLADLAGGALEAALAVAWAGLAPDAEYCRIAIIAMGKCGGRELNYVSDVDVVLVAEPLQAGEPGPDAAEREQRALATATRLATGLVRACTAATPSGSLFELDMGLRPEGRNGVLVRTLASYDAYYRRWARTWEFQALLKARPIAGDKELGAAWKAALDPLVWSSSTRPDFVADVQEMRRRVEASVPADRQERELKLGAGGLRDIEFAVQLLQLVHGRTDDELHSGTTLEALEALRDRGYVGRADADTFDFAYRWLRTAEHRLQLQHLRRTHSLPADPAQRGWLARAMGYRSGPRGDALEAFDTDRATQVRETRRLHEKLVYRPLLSTIAALPDDQLATDGLTEQSAYTRLHALGFTDTAAALRHIRAMTGGYSRRAAIQRALLPVVLERLSDSADPDAGLLAFRTVSDALGDTPWYLRQLRDEGEAAQNLAYLLATSRYVANLLIRSPEAVAIVATSRDSEALQPRSGEALAAAWRSVVGRNEDREAAAAAARGLRRTELLRIASAELLGLLTPERVGVALSGAATATIAAALDLAMREVSRSLGEPLPVRIAAIAMGRLGGGELGYGSDADVVFVHEPLPGVADARAADVARSVVEQTGRLLSLPAPDPPLGLDTGLRPEGRNGPLSRSLASWRVYHERWSQTWEAQALLRATFCAGDAELGERLLTGVIDPVRYPAVFTAGQADEVRRLKRRMERERLPRFSDRTMHLKLGPGGLSDVEWTVQLLQLQHAKDHAELRTPRTLPALRAEAALGLLADDDAALLEQAWTHAARLRNAIMLATGKAADVLPRESRAMAGVAGVLGRQPGPAAAAELLAEHRELAGRARAVVERVFGSAP
ncbi:MAG: (Glutamate--ammonia-ligase) adenylyltransferase [Mycobacterium sp.]|nr:(Glutamate--ammonia-ligase) adenylyltransferase [Mycobacterium sp.]